MLAASSNLGSAAANIHTLQLDVTSRLRTLYAVQQHGISIAIIAINAAVFCTMVAAPESDIGAAGAAAGASYFDPAGHWSAVLPTEMH